MKNFELASIIRGAKVNSVALLTAMSLGGQVFLAAETAQAQSSVQASYAIPAGPLGPAISKFGDKANLQILYRADLVRGKRTSGLSGRYSTGQALSLLLAGSGLSYQFSGSNTVTILDPNSDVEVVPPSDGSLLLDTINVTTGGNPTEEVYETAAPVDYISEDSIEHFRGANPSDIFQGTPGVMSGDPRNSGSAVDVNIRGMQGMGRVNVTIDGAMNSTTVYQGYQGISNRTYVDPDFIAGVDIMKGSDASSRGIAGTVEMRTLEARDIVKDGKNWGIRAKGGFGTNTAEPVADNEAGYDFPSLPYNEYEPIASPTGMDRPSFLEPTNGSGSIVAAYEDDRVELLGGYAYRKRGNYFAGTHGSHAEVVDTGPQEYCFNENSCYQPGHPNAWDNLYLNNGLANYRAGEEVLNTQLETSSALTKAGLKFGDGQALQLGYMWFKSEAGDRLASRLTSAYSQATQQEQTVGAELNTFTVKHEWEPAGNDWINLQSNYWYTDLERRNPRRAGSYYSPYQPEDFGLPANYRVGTDNVMWGGDITNTSLLDLAGRSLTLTYGGSYLSEDTRPSPYSQQLEDWLTIRDGARQEAAGFMKAAWEAKDWLTLNGGVRYQHFWSEDRTGPDTEGNYGPDELQGQTLNQGGWSPFAGVTIEPVKNTQFYVSYSDMERMPSLFESLTGFSSRFNPNLQPERSRNWEIGTNVIRKDVLASGDEAMIKFGYFNWDVQDYIAREWHQFDRPDGSYYLSMLTYNIDRAKFEGLELSARYEHEGFTADFAANYYLNVEFCKTAETCANKSLYADYATNQVPPEYTVSLTASQTFMDEKLTLGGRVVYIGPRSIGHGEVTAQGASQFINQIEWDPYTLVDVYAEYRLSEWLTAEFRVENLTDQFYIDPLSLVNQPGPGRTAYGSLTAHF
ncbi:MAG: TonB-dependent receptor domain-containing protein [Methyloligella sp. ZOD6]